MSMPYKDTVTSDVAITQAFGSFDFTAVQLLPSLNVSTNRDRTIVPRWVRCEVIPNISEGRSALIVAQLQLGTVFLPPAESTRTAFAIAPFKAASSINPTMYYFDFRKVGRLCPYILRPIRVTSFQSLDLSFIKFVVRSTTTGSELLLRITTCVDVLPQDEVQSPTRIAQIPYFSTQDEKDDELEAVTEY
jgi:hypothetical protein